MNHLGQYEWDTLIHITENRFIIIDIVLWSFLDLGFDCWYSSFLFVGSGCWPSFGQWRNRLIISGSISFGMETVDSTVQYSTVQMIPFYNFCWSPSTIAGHKRMWPINKINDIWINIWTMMMKYIEYINDIWIKYLDHDDEFEPWWWRFIADVDDGIMKPIIPLMTNGWCVGSIIGLEQDWWWWW